MATWKAFAEAAPTLAAFGQARFQSGVAYLGTLRPDGGPRVHPVTPIMGEQLFLFMEPTSPKGKDLQREGHFALHATVEDSNGGNGEFYIRGIATLVDDVALRDEAAKAGYKPQDHYILFTLSVEYAFMNIYTKGAPTVKRWQSGSDEG